MEPGFPAQTTTEIKRGFRLTSGGENLFPLPVACRLLRPLVWHLRSLGTASAAQRVQFHSLFNMGGALMTAHDLDQFPKLTSRAAADWLGVAPKTVYRFFKGVHVPGVAEPVRLECWRVGGRLRTSRAAIDRFLAALNDRSLVPPPQPTQRELKGQARSRAATTAQILKAAGLQDAP